MVRSSTPYHASTILQVEGLEERCLPSTAEYVTGLYNGILHRSPAPTEVAGWVDTLNAGASATEVARAFTTSVEHFTDEVQDDYTHFLGRQPAPEEIAGWLRQLQAGAGEKQVEASFLASEEYFSRQGSSAVPWLKRVYEDVLDRAPDQVGLNLWSQQLQAGISRAAVALAIVDSPEADSRLVSAVYLDLLGRDPDSPGLAGWIVQLQHGLAPSQLVAIIASSDEFIGRTAHGVLDMPVNPPASVDTPAPADAAASFPVDPWFDPFMGSPPVEPVTVVVDPVTVAIDPVQGDGCGCDPGTDAGGFDPGFDGGNFGGGSDGAGLDGSDGAGD